MLTVKNLRKTFGTRRILEKISFSIGEGQKVALVGQNGVGKSTVLKIISGLEPIEKGEVLFPNRALVGYLPQEALVESDETLLDYLRRMVGLGKLEEEMKPLEACLDEEAAMEKYELLHAEYQRLGGYDFERKARGLLEGLLLSHIGLDCKVAELSGGEKRKAALAGVLLRGVDILLLDEPTNNLDLPALLWLERYINRSTATCLIASHDRRFLDNVVKKVIEIDWYKRDATMYTGGWSDFSEMRAHAFRKHKEQYRSETEERLRVLQSADEKKEWAIKGAEQMTDDNDTMSRNFHRDRAQRKFGAYAKALENRAKRLHTIDKPLEREPLEIPLEPAESKVKNSIVLKKVCFGYPSGFGGGPVNLKIPFGERMAILGNNGVGKSTLLKTIAGEIPPLTGTVTVGSALRFGYLMQEHENIFQSITPAELFKKRLEIYDREIVSLYLSQFQFSQDVIDDKIKSLSPGERVRLILALLSASGANVLVLDEPTNHLDLEAIEALEEALAEYGGTILLVTHDRRFLEKMRLTKSFLLENGTLTPVESYTAYAVMNALQIERILKRLEEK